VSRAILISTVVAALAWPGASALFAQRAGAANADGSFVEITPESQNAVLRGIEYLKSQQQEDGSFGQDRYGRHVGITALAGLAFMGHGVMPGRGPDGRYVDRALQFVLNHVDPTGLIAAETSHGPMYGHGFATLFLAEVYGQSHDTRTREALVKAVRLIVGSQNKEGGWRYQPVSEDADVSVTICQVMALRAARNAGIKVPKQTIDKAVEYVKKCQNADGGFRYMMHSGSSAFPRSAAGVATLYYAGVYNDKSIDLGLQYLMSHKPGGTRGTSHYFYGHYYAVQAMFMAGGNYWREWFPAIREELIRKQDASSGAWSGQAGGTYGTSMALIILQIPNRYLPIFQK